MKHPLLGVTAAAFAATTLAFAGWLRWPWGVLLALPLAACLPYLWTQRPRAFVAAGALALPYLCYVIVEIVVAERPPIGAVATLAGGVAFFALLGPATRYAARLESA